MWNREKILDLLGFNEKTSWPPKPEQPLETSQKGSVDDAVRREQLKLVYDYIKFHIALYLATPTALALIADTLELKHCRIFSFFLILTVVIFLYAGSSAAWFMGTYIMRPWQSDYLEKFEKAAFSNDRFLKHHFLYWIGLTVGVLGIVLAAICCCIFPK
jgi:hypothetical protein